MALGGEKRAGDDTERFVFHLRHRVSDRERPTEWVGAQDFVQSNRISLCGMVLTTR
jgi:hypothetical protein